MGKLLLLPVLTLALCCLAAQVASKPSTPQDATLQQLNNDNIIVQTDYKLETNRTNEDNSEAAALKEDYLEGNNETNYRGGNESDCKYGNETNFSHCTNSSSTKINQILHLNLGSAFIPGIVISFCLLVLFF